MHWLFLRALLAVASTKDTHKKKQEELGALKEMNVSCSHCFLTLVLCWKDFFEETIAWRQVVGQTTSNLQLGISQRSTSPRSAACLP